LVVFSLNLSGNANIGIYLKVTEKFVLVPKQIPKSILHKIENWFKVKTIQTNVGGSILLGSLICANSKGIILPHIAWKEEADPLRSISDINLVIMKTKRTAYGNLILSNDKGAIVDPRVSKRDKKKISDALEVEVVFGEIAGLPHVGSLATTTNKGTLVHPMVNPKEEKLLEDVLKVKAESGTVNCGIPYISSGLIGNSQVAVTGSLTTGPELFMIEQALGMID
jgi:translation initiation factor 6